MSKNTLTTLGKISSIITGPFGSQLHQSDYVDVGIPSIMPQNISDRQLVKEGIAMISKDDANRLSRYLVKKNDIVYARRGDVEKHAFIDFAEEGAICGTGCLRVRTTSIHVNPLYLSFWLNRPETKRWISQHAVGSNMPNLNTDILSTVPVEYPDIVVQNAIATLLQIFDEKIALNKRINAELEAMAKTLYDYWFVQFDFPDENGKPYRTSGGAMEYNEQLKREIPKGWKVALLSSIVSIDNTSVNPSNLGATVMEHYSIPAFDDNHYPAFECANLIESGKYIVQPEAILVSKLNPKFKRIWDPFCITEQCICSTEFMCYQVNKVNLRPFCFALVNSNDFHGHMVAKAISSTGSRSRIQPDVSLTYKYAAPESDYLLQSFSDLYLPIMKMQKELYLANYELTRLRDWLLPMLMNGQATVE